MQDALSAASAAYIQVKPKFEAFRRVVRSRELASRIEPFMRHSTVLTGEDVRRIALRVVRSWGIDMSDAEFELVVGKLMTSGTVTSRLADDPQLQQMRCIAAI